MDVSEVRRQNLLDLLGATPRQNFAERIGYTDTVYLNQLITKQGSFGSRTARKIEKALHLESGWMDSCHNTVDASLDVDTLAQKYLAMNELDKSVVSHIVLKMSLNK